MLLTISTTHSPATDLGFLLHKHPDRFQSIDLAIGKAHIFYPESSDARTTAALLLDIDPIDMVKGKRKYNRKGFSLGQYVNDRPYVASSFLSVALSKAFSTAMNGKCSKKPELVDVKMPFEIKIAVLAAPKGGGSLIRILFEPLGYQVKLERHRLDDTFEHWGESNYFTVHLSHTIALKELLSHLYVLIPALDNHKHYYVSDDEIRKLLEKGKGWLDDHPEKEQIIQRYLIQLNSLSEEALNRLNEGEDSEASDEEPEGAIQKKVQSLHQQRLSLVLEQLKKSGAESVIDLGSGEGKLLRMLLKEKQFSRITGMDVSFSELSKAKAKLYYEEMAPKQKERIQLFQGALTYKDKRLEGFDAAAIVEVIEHLDEARLQSFERVVFEFAKLKTVIVTTPNSEYNALFKDLETDAKRHSDHRFEWTRKEFETWATRVSEINNYKVDFLPIGPVEEKVGVLHKWQYFIMELKVPELSLVMLIGVSGSGKSTFARKHFRENEVVSSDECRAIVANDENDLSATDDAFDLLHYILKKRLRNGLLTVIDATNVQPESRKGLVQLAREHHTLPVAIVLDLPQRVCEDRNKLRSDRNFGSHVIKKQKQQLKRSNRNLKREGFRQIYTLSSPEAVEQVTGVVREKLYNDKKELSGPFDIIGDIHGCYEETVDLLEKLGYQISQSADGRSDFGIEVSHPEGRKVIFLGDLVDRGPDSPAVLKLVMSMVRNGIAWCVPGNHDTKLQKKLSGKKVSVKHGLEETLKQLEKESEAFISDVKEFLYSLISHYVFDSGKLVVAHAGIKEEMQGRGSGAVRDFCLYGETTGETDEFGLPVRYNWASEYRGKAKVVYGHTPVPDAHWLNNTINIDNGCVFGGKLTALRYPEGELVSVSAQEIYCDPIRPLEEKKKQELTPQQEDDDLLNIEDVLGKRIVNTRLRNNISILEENSIAALEVMSRFAVNPKWLIYLPPTMSPSETSELPNYLEHPHEAINYYKKRGVDGIICEEKHMGSRVVVVVCKDEKVAQKRFGVINEGIGTCYTRTGRNFFTEPEMEREFLQKVKKTLTASGFWEKHDTDWVCLDSELMPWSAKAQSLLKEQYAAVGSAAQHSLFEVTDVLQQAIGRGIEEAQGPLDKFSYKEAAISKFTDAYRNYCWEVNSVEDYKLAPFHILATEGAVHIDKDHKWHMETIREICREDTSLFKLTSYKIVETGDEESVKSAISWWEELTKNGGEGMVVKPLDFIAYGKEGLIQPAVKCRGSEYLRIIYGAEYDMPENMVRLKNRNLSKKRSLALRELALGVEGLERFVKKEPLRRIHESVFGVLALESEEVDPRL